MIAGRVEIGGASVTVQTVRRLPGFAIVGVHQGAARVIADKIRAACAARRVLVPRLRVVVTVEGEIGDAAIAGAVADILNVHGAALQ